MHILALEKNLQLKALPCFCGIFLLMSDLFLKIDYLHLICSTHINKSKPLSASDVKGIHCYWSVHISEYRWLCAFNYEMPYRSKIEMAAKGS